MSVVPTCGTGSDTQGAATACQASPTAPRHEPIEILPQIELKRRSSDRVWRETTLLTLFRGQNTNPSVELLMGCQDGVLNPFRPSQLIWSWQPQVSFPWTCFGEGFHLPTVQHRPEGTFRLRRFGELGPLSQDESYDSGAKLLGHRGQSPVV